MTGPWAQRWRGSEKIAPAIAALIVNAVIGYALIVGLRAAPLLRMATDEVSLALFDLEPPPRERPPAAKPQKPREAMREGGGASGPAPPRTRQAEKAAVAAPPPAITLPTPRLPVAAPPTAVAVDAGAGAGGQGMAGEGLGSSGAGSGDGQGTGDGRGGNGGAFSRAKQTGGRFRNSDFPAWLRGVGRVKIGVRYAIGPSGHVDQCEVIERSGYAEVDAMTCSIIIERYRFRPARDPDGYAVSEVREEDYRWQVR